MRVMALCTYPPAFLGALFPITCAFTVYAVTPVAKYLDEQVKDEHRAYEMQQEVKHVLQFQVAGGEMLERVEGDVYQRSEEVDDAICEEVRRRHDRADGETRPGRAGSIKRFQREGHCR